MALRNSNSRCKATAKSGKPCRAAATAGGLCFFHANPDKASELGRVGGRRNRRTADETCETLPVLDNALAVRNTIARLVSDVFSGKLHVRVASGLAPLLNLQLRAIETADLEQRLAKLEEAFKEVKLPEPADDKGPKLGLVDFGDLPRLFSREATKPDSL